MSRAHTVGHKTNMMKCSVCVLGFTAQLRLKDSGSSRKYVQMVRYIRITLSYPMVNSVFETKF